MRVAAYSDVEYRRDGDSLYAPESFVVFMSRLGRFVDHLTLVGRLAPEPGRSHYRVPDDVGFVGLPHYAQLSRPWTAVGAMARSRAPLLAAARRRGRGLAARARTRSRSRS